MAAPTYYPTWATEDTTLPGTGESNKEQPKSSLQTVGWDKGEIPSAEEWNWELNNIYNWIVYLKEEVVDNLPTTYLPLTGTSITLTGDVTGTATFNGSKALSIIATVVDDSHDHTTSTITDATPDPTPSVIVKRNSTGGASFCDINIYPESAASTDAGNIFFYAYNSTTNRGNFQYDPTNDVLNLQKINSDGTTVGAYINIYSTYSTLYNPRQATTQETNAASLTRYDYVNTQVSNEATTRANAISSLTTYCQDTFVSDIRLGTRVTLTVSNVQYWGSGCVSTSASGDSDNEIQAQYAPIQKCVNSVWYTISG